LSGVERDLERFCRLALELGAAEAKPIRAADVAVEDWVRLKCQYGCGGYGRRLTCPPYSPTPEQTRRVLSGYDWAVLMRFEPARRRSKGRVHEATAKLEREVFLSGYYSAFGMASGPCPFCEECNLERCTHPHQARPSMEACGVDVYATARKAGFQIDVVRSRDQRPTYFGLLLVQ